MVVGGSCLLLPHKWEHLRPHLHLRPRLVLLRLLCINRRHKFINRLLVYQVSSGLDIRLVYHSRLRLDIQHRLRLDIQHRLRLDTQHRHKLCTSHSSKLRTSSVIRLMTTTTITITTIITTGTTDIVDTMGITGIMVVIIAEEVDLCLW